MPGGAAYYAYLVERQTTTEMSPEEIHQLGLNEVARIKQGMEAIKVRAVPRHCAAPPSTVARSEEHTSELQSLMRISYAVFCLKKNKTHTQNKQKHKQKY